MTGPSRRTVLASLATAGTVLSSGCVFGGRESPTEYTVTASRVDVVDEQYLVCILECTRSEQTTDTVDIEFQATVEGFPQAVRKRVVVDEEVENVFFSVMLPLRSEATTDAVESARVRLDVGERGEWLDVTDSVQRA